MCGIAGLVGEGPDLQEVGRSMAERLLHRGPDGHGVRVLSGPAGRPAGVFAHTRLAVIDLGTGAAQPFSKDRVQLTFNGEIYNFQELRRALEGRGHRFVTRSDTEVLLAQYLEHGEAGLDAIDGMFAFGIWDERDGRLLLGRDRAGKKPLYYAVLPKGGFAFASEAKALGVVLPLELEPARIPEYLAFGYVGTPNSIFRGVHRLPPACRLELRPGREPSIRPYWDLEARTREPLVLSVPDALREVRSAVGAAVERRLVADVPLGAFLSGGVDSSLIVAEMAKRGPVRTFAVGFDDDATYDESPYAARVAQRFGTDHTELRLKPDPGAMFERLLYHHDEPYGDSSALAVHAVAEATRAHVTVVLTGDGGDEIFGGYTRFSGGLWLGRMPRALARAASAVLERLPEPGGYKNPFSLARRFVEHPERSEDEQLLAFNAYFAGPRLARLLRADVFGPKVDPWAPLAAQAALLSSARAAGRDRLAQILLHNHRTYLLDDLLVKTDRMTMAVGLEARSPLLDTALVELAFRLPSALKIRRGQLKWILREAYRDVLGPEVVDRKKHGFGVPLGRWWRGPLRPLLAELLETAPRITSFLDGAELRRLIAEHLDGRRDHGQRLFALAQLELFLRARR